MALGSFSKITEYYSVVPILGIYIGKRHLRFLSVLRMHSFGWGYQPSQRKRNNLLVMSGLIVYIWDNYNNYTNFTKTKQE
jgi:hypothetical protein